jgi:hypothetical protein
MGMGMGGKEERGVGMRMEGISGGMEGEAGGMGWGWSG